VVRVVRVGRWYVVRIAKFSYNKLLMFFFRTYKEVDLQLGKTLVKGGDVDRIVYDDKGRIVMGMFEVT
jgi:hypothetical protein